MDNTYAAFAMVQACRQKSCERVASFVAIEAVQVNFILRDPAPAAQIAQDALRYTLMQVMRFVTTFKPVLQLNAAMQALVQRRALVGDVLQRTRRGWAGSVLDKIGGRLRLDAGHGCLKGSLLGAERNFWRGSIRVGQPLCRQSLVPTFFWRAGRVGDTGRWLGLRDSLRSDELNAIQRRKWLDVSHFRLEGSEVFRVDQIQAS